MRPCVTRSMAFAVVLSLILGIFVACAQGPKVQTAEEFYRGKTFIWVSVNDIGSGADLIVRAVMPYLAKELGATVKIENLGTDEGVNYVYNEAPRDGLTIVVKSTGAVIANDILKAPGVLYESEKFNYVSDVNPSRRVLSVSPKFPNKTLDGLRQAKGLRAGGTSAKGSIATGAAVTMEILGLDGQIVTGFKGTKDLTLAVSRGEIDVQVSSDNSAKRDAADGHQVNLAVLNKEKSPALPDLPTWYELGVNVRQELQVPLDFILASGQATALPPGVPQDRVEYLRKAFARTSDNQDLQKEMEAIVGAPNPFGSGKELQDTIAAMKANKSLAERVDAIFEKYKTVK
ncbi:MAG: hypothetical protein HYY30_05100 [Chloroflexi bacterium]|nr:hypothetical protein [Chloroflexota bacterium]